MAKKTLNEATIRRFQKLAKVNSLNETYYGRDDKKMEDAHMEEGAHLKDEDMHKEEMHEEMHEEEGPEEMEMDADEAEMEGESDLELTDEEAEAIIALGKKLEAAMGEEETELAPMDAEEAPEMAAAEEEEEEMMEALAGINLQATNEEIVNEVANRVAKRLKAAKLHEAKLNKALGRK